MKILALCQKGNSRSVALAFIFKKETKHECLAAGMVTTGRDTLNMLYEWADTIILLAPRYEKKIPEIYKSKLSIWNITDYFNGHDHRLIDQLKNHLKKEKF